METRDDWRNPMGTPGAQNDATRMKDDMAEKARGLAGQAREATGKLAGRAREQANRLVEDRKGQAVSSLDSLSGVLRDSAGRLRGEQSFFGDYAEGAAERVDRLARYLRESDPERFLRDAEDFARRRPEVFVGGMFVTGLLLARFLKSSSGYSQREYAHAGGSMGGGGSMGTIDRDFDTTGFGTTGAGTTGGVGSRTGAPSTNRPNRGADIAPDDESGLGV